MTPAISTIEPGWTDFPGSSRSRKRRLAQGSSRDDVAATSECATRISRPRDDGFSARATMLQVIRLSRSFRSSLGLPRSSPQNDNRVMAERKKAKGPGAKSACTAAQRKNKLCSPRITGTRGAHTAPATTALMPSSSRRPASIAWAIRSPSEPASRGGRASTSRMKFIIALASSFLCPSFISLQSVIG